MRRLPSCATLETRIGRPWRLNTGLPLAVQPATETREVTSDPEQRERQELRGRASLTNYLTAAISRRQVTGAELELRQASRRWGWQNPY